VNSFTHPTALLVLHDRGIYRHILVLHSIDRTSRACWLCKCYKRVKRVVLLALAVLQMCRAGGVADNCSVTKVSRGWCYWLWQRYKRVTLVVLLLSVLKIFGTSPFISFLIVYSFQNNKLNKILIMQYCVRCYINITPTCCHRSIQFRLRCH
jgi:hypothetical protein